MKYGVDSLMRSVHPYLPFIPDDAMRLIVGSLPPERFCVLPKCLKEKDVDFYYGSKDNHFWKLLAQVADVQLDYDNSQNATEQRMKLLTALGCGITDVVASCTRSKDSASDSNLTTIVYQPIFQYIADHPTIQMLIYTSHFVQTQVYRHFTTVFGKSWQRVSLDARHHQLHFPDGRILDDITLYSPSPQALKGLGKGGKEKRLAQYREVFNN
ncbi:MAG: hypothetical protein QM610_08700 [Chitinophagaceae bacterium]